MSAAADEAPAYHGQESKMSGVTDRLLQTQTISAPKWQFVKQLPFQDSIKCLAEDGEGNVWCAGTNRIHVRNVESGDEVQVIEGKSAPKAKVLDVIAMVRMVSPDGDSMWCGCHDGYIRTYSPTTYAMLKEIAAHTSGIMCMIGYKAFIFSGSCDYSIKMWDSGGNCVHTFTGHTNWVRALAISYTAEDKAHLWSGSQDETLRKWDIDTATQVGPTLQGHGGGVLCLAAVKDTIWSGGVDKKVALWNVADGSQVRVFKGHKNWVSSLLNLNDRLIWTGSPDKQVIVWDVQEKVPLQTFALEAWVWCLAIIGGSQGSGSRVWCSSNDKLVSVYRLWGSAQRQTVVKYAGRRGRGNTVSQGETPATAPPVVEAPPPEPEPEPEPEPPKPAAKTSLLGKVVAKVTPPKPTAKAPAPTPAPKKEPAAAKPEPRKSVKLDPKEASAKPKVAVSEEVLAEARKQAKDEAEAASLIEKEELNLEISRLKDANLRMGTEVANKTRLAEEKAMKLEKRLEAEATTCSKQKQALDQLKANVAVLQTQLGSERAKVADLTQVAQTTSATSSGTPDQASVERLTQQLTDALEAKRDAESEASLVRASMEKAQEQIEQLQKAMKGAPLSLAPAPAPAAAAAPARDSLQAAEFKATLAKMQERENQLRTEVRAIQSELMQAQHDYTDRSEAIQSQLEAKTEELHRAGELGLVLMKQKNDLELLLQQKEAELQELTAMVQHLNDVNLALKEEKDTLVSSHAPRILERLQSVASLAAMETPATLDQAHELLVQRHADVQQATELAQQLSAQMFALEKSLAVTNSELKASKGRVDELERSKSALSSRVLEMTAMYEEAEGTARVANNKLRTGLSEAERMRSELENAKGKTRSTIRDREKLEIELQRLRAEVEHQARTISTLEARLDRSSAKQGEIAYLEGELAKAFKELDGFAELKRNKAALEESLSELNTELFDSKNKVKEYQKVAANVAQVQSANKKLKKEVSDWRQLYRDAQAEVARLMRANEGRGESLESLYALKRCPRCGYMLDGSEGSHSGHTDVPAAAPVPEPVVIAAVPVPVPVAVPEPMPEPEIEAEPAPLEEPVVKAPIPPDYELAILAKWVNDVLALDPAMANHLPLSEDPTSRDLIKLAREGILLCKLVNIAQRGTIDERVVNLSIEPESTDADGVHSYSEETMVLIRENQSLCLQSAFSVGAELGQMGVEELCDGDIPSIKLFIWQIIMVKYLQQVNLRNHPELRILRGKNEAVMDFASVQPAGLLRRWIDFVCQKREPKPAIGADFAATPTALCILYEEVAKLIGDTLPTVDRVGDATDIDFECARAMAYAEHLEVGQFVSLETLKMPLPTQGLMHMAHFSLVLHLHPGCIPLPALEEKSAQATQIKELVFNEDDSKEERVIKIWLNSLGLESRIGDLGSDLRDGLLLLTLLDQSIAPGSVVWKKVSMIPDNQFKRLGNLSHAFEIMRGPRLKMKVLGIGPEDIHSGNVKLSMALMWQLLYKHVLSLLNDIDEPTLIAWANTKVENMGSPHHMKNLKDKSLATSLFFLDLLESVCPGTVKREHITTGATREDCEINAKYFLSVARKLGIQMFVVWEDIVGVKSKMLLTLVAAIKQKGDSA